MPRTPPPPRRSKILRRNGDVIVGPWGASAAQAVEPDRSQRYELRDGRNAVIIEPSGYTTFGRYNADGSELQVSRAYPSKTYANWLQAEKAAARYFADIARRDTPAEAVKTPRFTLNDVVRFKHSGRRRYVVVSVDTFGQYLLSALSGGDAGSGPSGVLERDLVLDDDQTIAFTGVNGHKLQRRYESYLRQFGKRPDLVAPRGEIKVEPGVRLMTRLRTALSGNTRYFKGGKLSYPPGGKKHGLVRVTVSGWKDDGELLEKLHDVYDKIIRAGLHVNNVEAYLGRILVSEQEQPVRNAEKVWAEFARIEDNARVRGTLRHNPRKAVRRNGRGPYDSMPFDSVEGYAAHQARQRDFDLVKEITDEVRWGLVGAQGIGYGMHTAAGRNTATGALRTARQLRTRLQTADGRVAADKQIAELEAAVADGSRGRRTNPRGNIRRNTTETTYAVVLIEPGGREYDISPSYPLRTKEEAMEAAQGARRYWGFTKSTGKKIIVRARPASGG